MLTKYQTVITRTRVPVLVGDVSSDIPSLVHSDITITPYDFVANNIATGAVVATFQDIYGNPIIGQPVTLSIGPMKTVSASLSVASLSPSSVANNGSSVTNIIVEVFNTLGERVAGFPTELIVVTSTGTGNTISAASAAVTDEDGMAFFTMSSTVAEAKTLTVTVKGVELDDNPVVTFTGSPPTGFPTDPGYTTTVADWENEVTLDADGVVMDGNPNTTTGALHRRVTSGYPAGQAFGGPANMEIYQRGAKRGGYDPGRAQVAIPAGVTQLYAAIEHCYKSDYPLTNNDGGGKLLFVTFVTSGRYFVNLDVNPSLGNGYYDVYGGPVPFTSARLMAGSVLAVRGAWTTIELFLTKVGAGSDIMAIYIDGVLSIYSNTLTFPATDFASAYHDGSNNGNHLSPATYECFVTGASGTFDPAGQETVTWSGGTGTLQMTTPASGVTPTMLFILLATGVAPTAGQVITGSSSGATATASSVGEIRGIGEISGAPVDMYSWISKFKVSVQ